MKICEAYAALLDPFVDGELPPETAIRVQEHLDTCPACRGYVDDALAIHAALEDAQNAPVPDGFTDRVMERVRESTPAKKAPGKSRRWAQILVPLAACCAVVILLGPVLSGRNATSTIGNMESTPASAASGEADMGVSAMDIAPEESAAESNLATAQKAREFDGQSMGDAAELPLYSSAPVVSALNLPPQAAPLLEDREPLWQTETECCYELTEAEYADLADALAASGIDAPAMTSTNGTVTVIVETK